MSPYQQFPPPNPMHSKERNYPRARRDNSNQISALSWTYAATIFVHIRKKRGRILAYHINSSQFMENHIANIHPSGLPKPVVAKCVG